jgi:hypothetical protein
MRLQRTNTPLVRHFRCPRPSVIEGTLLALTPSYGPLCHHRATPKPAFPPSNSYPADNGGHAVTELSIIDVEHCTAMSSRHHHHVFRNMSLRWHHFCYARIDCTWETLTATGQYIHHVVFLLIYVN